MAALIFEKKVVQERTDLNPVTGCWRVVYEKRGEGASFKQLLDGEAKLQTEKRGIVKAVAALVSEPDYIVYAVSKERNLLLEFPHRVAHQNNRNYFDLNFKTEYQVADPKVLIERLRFGKDDPLTRLRDTIASEIGAASGRVAWDIIRDEYAFGDVAEDLTAADSEVFHRIQGKARYLGLEVTSIRFSLRLLEKDLLEWKDDVEHGRTIAREKRDLEVTRVSEDIIDEQAKRALRRDTWKGGAEALTTSLNRIGTDTDTAAKLRDNLEVLRSILPQVTVPGSPVAALPERSRGLLTSNAQLIDPVMCTVFAPARASLGQNIMVQVYAHLVQHDDVVKKRASEFDEQTKRLAAKRLDHGVRHGSKLTFSLSIPDLDIDEPVQELIWHGEPDSVQFGVRIAKDLRQEEVIGTVYVSQDGVPFGHAKFLLRIRNDDRPHPAKGQVETTSDWKRYQYAFISYASADLPEVLKRVQMLSRFHIGFFQDLLTLEPGEEWAKAIYESIDKSDVFFLFWSSAARASSWVMDEVRYALARKGADQFAAPDIVPVIIEGPPLVPPPPELGDIAFNDKFIYFIAGSTAGR